MASQETRQMEYEHKKREYADYLRSKAQEVDQQSSITQVLNYYGISFNNSRQCLCPFHQDSKPSMSAERNDKYVHCFVDNQTWYTINFIKDYEAKNNGRTLGLYDRIQKAIDIQGLNIELLSFREYFSLGEKKISREEARSTRLKNIMQDAANAAKSSLLSNDTFAIQSMKYLKSRKLSEATIRNFNIGVEYNNRMIRYLTNEKRYATEQLVDDGLLKLDVNTGEVRNTFRNRVLVPICDEYGRVVGFGGRVLDDRKPKYLNTSENEIFHKSDILFNYHQAKTFAKNNELVIVEGYFDVISAYEMGMKNVTALMGVALSEQHIELIKKLNCDVVICLDNPSIDKAGKNAMVKIVPQLLEQGINVSVYDTGRLGKKLKDFGDFNENGKTKEDIFATKITGFEFLMKYHYFDGKDLSVENVANNYKRIKRDGLIKSSLDELKYKEYVLTNSTIAREDYESIIHPQEVKIEITDDRIEKAMRMRFVRLIKKEILSIATANNNKELVNFIQKGNLADADILEGMNNEKYCSEDGRNLDVEAFINEYVINLESHKKNLIQEENSLLNKFKEMLDNVWTYDELKTPIKVYLTESQKEQVLKQYEQSFPEKEARKEFEDYPELYTKLFIANEKDDYDRVAKPMSSVLRERWKMEQFNLGYMALVPYNDCFSDSITTEEKKKISPEYIALTKVKDIESKNYGKPVYYFKSLVVFNNYNGAEKITLTKENFIEPPNIKQEKNKQVEKTTVIEKNNKQSQSISINIPLVKNEFLKTGKGIYILTPNDKQQAIFLENGHFKFGENAIEYNVNHKNTISLYKLSIAGDFQTREFAKRLERNEFLKTYRGMYYNKQTTELTNEERSA